MMRPERLILTDVHILIYSLSKDIKQAGLNFSMAFRLKKVWVTLHNDGKMLSEPKWQCSSDKELQDGW